MDFDLEMYKLGKTCVAVLFHVYWFNEVSQTEIYLFYLKKQKNIEVVPLNWLYKLPEQLKVFLSDSGMSLTWQFHNISLNALWPI